MLTEQETDKVTESTDASCKIEKRKKHPLITFALALSGCMESIGG